MILPERLKQKPIIPKNIDLMFIIFVNTAVTPCLLCRKQSIAGYPWCSDCKGLLCKGLCVSCGKNKVWMRNDQGTGKFTVSNFCWECFLESKKFHTCLLCKKKLGKTEYEKYKCVCVDCLFYCVGKNMIVREKGTGKYINKMI